MSSWVRHILPIVPLGIVMGGILALVMWLQQPGRFPLRVIEIQDTLKWTSTEVIKQTVSEYMTRGFFGLDVEAVQARLSALPWIASVGIQRIWPDRVLVTLKEQMPLARFGERAVLSTEGRLFYPDLNALPSKLPCFKGPETQAAEMFHHYFILLEMLSPLGLAIDELQLSPDGSWRIMLDNGIAIILGKVALNERLGRFALVYPNQLQKEIPKIDYLDLRYTNGLAIGWKTAVQ